MQSEFVTLDKLNFTLDRVQTVCGYSDLDTLRVVWKSVLPGVKFPKRYETVAPDQMQILLSKLATPTPGKGPQVVAGALSLLNVPYESESQNGANKPGNGSVSPDISDTPIASERKRRGRKPKAETEQKPETETEQKPETETDSNPKPNESKLLSAFRFVFELWPSNYFFIILISVCSVLYGCWLYMDTVGLMVAAIYTLVIVEAFKAAKNATATSERGLALAAVIALEVFAGFIHFAWINEKLWKSAARLPFHWSEYDKALEATVNTTPGVIAVVFASIVSAASVYAVMQQTNRTTDNLFN